MYVLLYRMHLLMNMCILCHTGRPYLRICLKSWLIFIARHESYSGTIYGTVLMY